MKSCVVLVSGGLDSATVVALAKAQGYQVRALSFDYAQRHRAELIAARKVVQHFNCVDHQIIELPFHLMADYSALTSVQQALATEAVDHIPNTYVPARNTIFLSFALAFAEVHHIQEIWIGASMVDYSGYPDCRDDYFQALNALFALATKSGVEGQPCRVVTPLLYWSKAQTIQSGLQLGVDYSQTVSCYGADHEGRACATCDSCRLRRQGFLDAGVPDPTLYQSNQA